MKHKEEFLKALHKEIVLRSNEATDSIKTIYIGGGTPSILKADEIIGLFEGLTKEFKIDPDAEISFEINPDDVEDKWLKNIKLYTPINRFSVGIQSFQEDALSFMNRAHSKKQAIYAVQKLQDAGYQNISIDLIYGVPAGNEKKWREDIALALSLQPQHISSYALTVEDKTLLHYQIKKGMIKEMVDGEQEKCYTILCELMKQAGYGHYEISSFSQETYQSKHNSSYWNRVPYIGIGPSAHSFDGFRKRSWNVANNAQYIKSLMEGKREGGEELLGDREVYNEIILTGLRTAKGVYEKDIEVLCGKKFLNYFMQNVIQIPPLIARDKRWVLQEKDWFFCDAITRALLYV